MHMLELEIPDGNLRIDKEKNEINIFRSFALSEEGAFVFYSRLYPPQQGVEEVVAAIDRMLERAYTRPMNEDFLARQFEKYIVHNLDFIEKVTIRPDTSSEAEIQGMVSFHPCEESVISIEEGEYSVCLTRGFIDKISEAYRKNSGRDLSARRRKVLARKQDPLKVDTFLRAMDIHPAASKYQSNRVYRNLRKCTSFLADITFRDAIHPYSANFPTLGDRRKQK